MLVLVIIVIAAIKICSLIRLITNVLEYKVTALPPTDTGDSLYKTLIEQSIYIAPEVRSKMVRCCYRASTLIKTCGLACNPLL